MTPCQAASRGRSPLSARPPFWFWMWEVKRLLLSQKSMTDSAAAQLATCRQRAIQDPCDPEAAQVLHRSESIYRQAVDHYNRALSRPLICLPGRLLGFRPISTEDKGD